MWAEMGRTGRNLHRSVTFKALFGYLFVAVTQTSNFIAIFSALRELRVRIFVSLTNCFELTNGTAIFKSISNLSDFLN